MKEIYTIGLTLLLIAFLVSSYFTVYYAILSTKSVPTDSLVTRQRVMTELKIEFDALDENTGKPLELYCNICNVYVNEKTKHCG